MKEEIPEEEKPEFIYKFCPKCKIKRNMMLWGAGARHVTARCVVCGREWVFVSPYKDEPWKTWKGEDGVLVGVMRKVSKNIVRWRDIGKKMEEYSRGEVGDSFGWCPKCGEAHLRIRMLRPLDDIRLFIQKAKVRCLLCGFRAEVEINDLRDSDSSAVQDALEQEFHGLKPWNHTYDTHVKILFEGCDLHCKQNSLPKSQKLLDTYLEGFTKNIPRYNVSNNIENADKRVKLTSKDCISIARHLLGGDAVPSPKSPQMEAAMEKISMLLYGRSRLNCIKNNICVMCGSPAKEFRNELSRKEFTISGMCQKCQDKIFGVD